MARIKVLFFAAWYPHRYDAMAGLFVRKHAAAVAQYADVCVLYPFPDENIDKVEVVESETMGVREIYVYYPFAKSRMLRTISKAVQYIRAFFIGYNHVVSKFGVPDVTHAHVLTRAAVLSYLLHVRKKIPYVVTEQWSRYFPESHGYSGIVRKKVTEIVVKQAYALLPVSQTLAEAMQGSGLRNSNVCCVGNVVDDFFFQTSTKQARARKRIIHVSCFDEKAKNIKGILRVIQRLSDERFDFELVVVGTGPDYDAVVSEAHNLQLLNTVVQFVGEQTPEQVGEWMRQSDFFVLFSNYETFATVLPEALASGIPVVSSQVGIAPSVVTANNGSLVPVGDEEALYTELNWMLDHCEDYDEAEIRDSARRFSFENIGKQLVDVYQSAIERS